jgi:hypothetical protein
MGRGTAVVVGALRLASGVSFLVSPQKANRLWGDTQQESPTTLLLLRSMGYRDALVGGLLMSAGLRGRPTRGWYLASAGADLADLVGGLAVHDRMTSKQKAIGLGGAAVGIAVGVGGALHRQPRVDAG